MAPKPLRILLASAALLLTGWLVRPAAPASGTAGRCTRVAGSELLWESLSRQVVSAVGW